MINSEIIVALLGLVGTAVGSGCGVVAASRLTNYRLEQLEKKVDKQSSVIERMYRAEERIHAVEAQMKTHLAKGA